MKDRGSPREVIGRMGTSENLLVMARCDKPGCLSRVTEPYLVGLGGMVAYYCADHAPGSNQESRQEGT